MAIKDEETVTRLVERCLYVDAQQKSLVRPRSCTEVVRNWDCNASIVLLRTGVTAGGGSECFDFPLTKKGKATPQNKHIMTKSLLIPATLSSSSSSLPTYAEQVKEVLAVGGDPWFLSNNNGDKNVFMMWDVDESAHFGGWETTEAKAATAPEVTSATYAELAREVKAVGGDLSFLVPPEEWDGTVDEAAHFGGWEN
jgi:hypothetical protein